MKLAARRDAERAARGEFESLRYPWGDELTPGGKHRCNIWQGKFPERNAKADGYLSTAPVDAYQPNGYGLYNVAGNVWEWCADWWSAGPWPREGVTDPAGPETGSGKVTRSTNMPLKPPVKGSNQVMDGFLKVATAVSSPVASRLT